VHFLYVFTPICFFRGGGGVIFHLCYLYLFTYTIVQHDFHIKWCSCRLTVTRRVSLMEQELLTLQKHLLSPLVLSEVLITQSLVSVELCRSLFILTYVCFLLDIVLSTLLRFMASDYSVGILWRLITPYVSYGVWLLCRYLMASDYSVGILWRLITL
jgi:hypothetical protein